MDEIDRTYWKLKKLPFESILQQFVDEGKIRFPVVDAFSFRITYTHLSCDIYEGTGWTMEEFKNEFDHRNNG
jgi:hypothetical protein